MKFFAVDPGDVHVGISYFEGEACVSSWESGPTDAMRFLGKWIPGVDLVVVERYQLYPNKAQLQQGSDLRTSQMIGAIKWLSYQHSVPVVIQQAALKTTAEHLINRRGVVRQSLGEGGHAKDSETHGYAYLWRRELHDLEEVKKRAEEDVFGV